MIRNIRVGVAVAAAACLLGALPAVASAGVLYSGASEVAVGTQVSGTTSGYGEPILESGATCAGARLSGTVAKNGTTTADINVSSLQFYGTQKEEKCASSYGAVAVSLDATPACLSYRGSGSWLMRGSVCSAEPTGLHLTLAYSSWTCHYTKSTSMLLNSNVNSEPLVVNGQETVFTRDAGQSPFCVAPLTLRGLNLKLETASGGGLRVL
jgi:hypothetical protein